MGCSKKFEGNYLQSGCQICHYATCCAMPTDECPIKWPLFCGRGMALHDFKHYIGPIGPLTWSNCRVVLHSRLLIGLRSWADTIPVQRTTLTLKPISIPNTNSNPTYPTNPHHNYSHGRWANRANAVFEVTGGTALGAVNIRMT